MLITSTFFLADASAFTGNVWLTFGVIAAPICSVIAVIISSRRNPPIGEEVHKNFVPRTEFNEAVARVDARVDAALIEVAAARTQFGKAFGDLERAIGRLEGRLDVMDNHERAKAHRPHH